MRKWIGIILILSVCAGLTAQDAKNFGRYTTLRLACSKNAYDTHENKILTTLCRYEFKTSSLTQAMTNQVLARFDKDNFCAIVNPSIDVYVYDCPVQKAGNIFSWSDLAQVKTWVDNNPQIFMDWIRDDERNAFDTNAGVRLK